MNKIVAVLIMFFISVFAPALADVDPMYELDTPPNLFIPQNDKAPVTVDPKTYTPPALGAQKAPSYPIASQNSGGKQKKSFFSRKNSKNAKPKPEFDTVGGGYTGVIPKIESEFQYKKPKTSTVKKNENNAEEYTPEEFQESKIDDPLFLDAILNKGKPSSFVVDMIRVMRFLETFRAVIANHENVQKFNANVNLLDLHARRIENLYKEQPEGMSPSYWMLLDLNYKAKVLGNLKFDANYYSKFSPVTGTEYDPEYLIEEDNKLLIQLDKTIFEIRQLNN